MLGVLTQLGIVAAQTTLKVGVGMATAGLGSPLYVAIVSGWISGAAGSLASSAGMGIRNFLALEKQDVGAAFKNLLVDTAMGGFTNPINQYMPKGAGGPKRADQLEFVGNLVNKAFESATYYSGNP